MARQQKGRADKNHADDGDDLSASSQFFSASSDPMGSRTSVPGSASFGRDPESGGASVRHPARKSISESIRTKLRLKPRAKRKQREWTNAEELPRFLYGRPLEDIDSRIYEKTFCVIAERFKQRFIYRFTATNSLFLLSPWNPIRRGAIYIATHEYFDYFVILTILVNCVFLTLSKSLEAAEYVFLGIYTFEMVIKVIARGFIVNRHTYLREAWNWLDFIVIVLGYSTFLLQHFGVEVGNIAGIRTFRVLRALKTVSIVPGLKTIVNALLHSLRMLGEVMALTIFCMMIFALFALQVYIGVLRQKCVADAPDYVANSSDFNYTDWTQNEENWYYADHSPIVCGNTSMSRPCPTNYTCLPHIGENPNFGFTSFDDFGWAMLTSFQLITLDFWEDVYNKIIEAMGPANIFFFIFVIFFGSFFLVNLMLAVVAMSYEEAAEEVERQHDKGTKLVLKTKSTVFEFPDAKQMRIKIRKLKKTSFGVKRKDVLHRKRSPDDDDGSFTTSQRGGSDGTGIGGYYTPSSQTPETTPRTDNLAASPSELPPAGSPDNDGEGANGIRMVITPPPNDDEASASYSLSPSASDYAESTAGRSSYSPDSPDRHNSNNNMGTDVDDDDDTYAGLFQRLKHRGKLQRNRRVADDDMDDVDINCVELHPRAVGHAELSPPCSTNSVGSDDRLLDDFDVQYRYSPPTSPRRGSTVSGDDVGLDDYIDTNRWPNRGSNGISSVAADADRYPRIADRPAIETTMLGGATRPEYAPRAYLSSRQRRSFPTPDEMLNTCGNESDGDDGDDDDEDDGDVAPWQKVFRQVSLSIAGLPERGNSLINLSPWKTLIEAKIQSIRGEDAPFKFLRPLSEKLGIGGDPEAAGAAGRPPEARPEPVSPLTNAVPSRVPTFPRNRRVTFGPAESLSFRNPTPEPGNRAARGPLAEAGDGRSYLWPVDDNNKNNNMGEETGALKINGPREEPEGQESNTNNKFISQEDELYTQNNAAVNKDGDDDDGGGDASPKTNSDPNARNCACFRRLCCCYTPWLRFQQWLFTIVTDPLFDLFITLCIVLNTAFLAVEHHGMTDRTRHTLEIGNYVFTLVFTLEAILKITALCKEYFQSGWNIFDLVIVIASLLDMFLENVDGLSVLRTMRLLRVFKLAQSWPTMKTLLSIIVATIGALGNLTLILIIVIYIFAVIGMQQFGVSYTEENFYPDEVPRWNLVDFMHAFMMVFRILCGEWIEPLWDCMRVAQGSCVAFFMPTMVVGNFMVLNLFLALLLNSFAADSLSSSDSNADENNPLKQGLRKLARLLHLPQLVAHWPKALTFSCKDEDEDDDKPGPYPVPENNIMVEMSAVRHDQRPLDFTETSVNHVPDSIEAGSIGMCSSPGDSITQQSAPKLHDSDRSYSIASRASHKLSDYTGVQNERTGSLQYISSADPRAHIKPCFPHFLFRRCQCFKAFADSSWARHWFSLRIFMYRIVDHKIFEGLVLFVIFASSLTLVFEDVYLDEKPVMKEALFYLNITFLVLFVVEMLMKWIAYGFHVYFTNFWCILDCFIVVVSLMSTIMETQDSGNSDLMAFRSLRTLRALRPLRAISRWEGMKIVVNALMFAIPSICNVLLVCVVFWLIFSIMGVQFYGGQFYKCVDGEGERLPTYVANNRSQCEYANYTWENSNINFDNVLSGYLALFQVATFEGWMEVMEDAVDARGIDMQPSREANIYAYFYFVLFIIFGSFFTLNLFIGVIIDNFNMLKKKYEGGIVDVLLTASQRNYYNTMKRLGNKKPQKTIKPPKVDAENSVLNAVNRIQRKFYDFVNDTRFEVFVVSCIFINMVFMALEHYQQSEVVTEMLEYVNMAFTIIFTVEFLLKFIGLRFYYFWVPWNVFDFTVVALSLLALMLDDLIRNVFVTPTLLRVIRVFRIGRVLRLIKAAKGIRKLLFALIISLPALFNIGALLFLIMFIYAIIGMTSFGNLRLGGALNEVVNFQTFGNSMVLLFRLCTSAGWNDVLEPLLRTPGCDPDFSGLPTYEAGGCGSPWLAVPYLTSYILIAFMIIINMYIAIILENFNLAHAQEEVGITEDDIDMFYAHWSRFDQNATQLINFSELSDFVAGLDPPFCIPKPNNIALTSFNLPIVEGDKLHCLDVIRALTKFAMSDVEETAEFAMLQSNIEDKFKEAFPTRRKIIIVSSTMDRKREDRAAKSIQHAWRRWRSRDEAANSTPSINALAAAATPSLFRKAAMKRFLRTPTSQRRSRSPSPSRRQGLSRNDSSRTASQRSLAVPVSTV